MTKTETRWAIVGDYGLYTGQCLTRREAILEHVNAKGVPNGNWGPTKETLYSVPVGVEALMKGWRYWRKQGDRAVKTTITWTA